MTQAANAPMHTREVFEFLKRCAGQMRTVHYDEISKNAGGFAPRGIGKILGYIRDDICRPRGLPWLSVIAVGKNSWIPGDDYFGMPVLEGVDRPTQERIWRGMVLQVFAYDWSRVEIDN